MNRVAKFYKVSFEQYIKDFRDTFGEHFTIEEIRKVYDGIKLPKRATKGSAGHDIFSPINFVLEPNETVKIPTGIRCEIEDGWVLHIYPRSSLGFKYRLQLDNVVGIIDEDYFYSDNEGHIFIKMTNCSNEDKTVTVNADDAFAQGIFLQYGLTYDDNTTGIRNGGFGSTNQEHE